MSTPIKPLRRDAAENRQRLLTAAALVFAVSGPEAGVDEVARAAGVGMGTLYRRFPTKQALVDELVADLRGALAAVGRHALAQPADRALEELLRGSGAVLFEHRGCLHKLWQESEAGLDLLEEYRHALGVTLVQAQQAGVARAELELSDISLALWALRGVIEMTRTVAPDAWKRHLELTLAGIRPGPIALREPAMTAEESLRLTTTVHPSSGNVAARTATSFSATN